MGHTQLCTFIYYILFQIHNLKDPSKVHNCSFYNGGASHGHSGQVRDHHVLVGHILKSKIPMWILIVDSLGKLM